MDTPSRDAQDEREIAAHESFNYAIHDVDESRLLGCVYLDPPLDGDDCDVIVSWWVIDDCVDTELAHELDRFLPHWVTTAWPLRRLASTPEPGDGASPPLRPTAPRRAARSPQAKARDQACQGWRTSAARLLRFSARAAHAAHEQALA
jgi:hypothetical protein